MKKVTVDQLSPGMRLAENIYGMDKKRLLLKKGTLLSQEMIYGLFKKNIAAVLIEEKEDNEETSIDFSLPPDVKRKNGIPYSYPESVEQKLFMDYEGSIILKIDDPVIHETKKKAVKTAHKILQGISKGGKLDIKAAEETADELINTISMNKSAFMNIAGMRMIDEYTFIHSVNVAAYTTIIAMEYGAKEQELEIICTGAFLHDVGKMLIDPEILNKPGKLTNEEFEEIKTHSLKGYKILKENEINEEIAILAKGHHERYDGQGYPSGLNKKNSPISIQMAAIADVYDALTSDRVYKKAMGSSEAMRIIISETGSHFEPKLVGLFQRAIGIYPIGSLVKLNNGYTARILGQNEGIVRPIIQLLYDENGKELDDKVILNLMDSNEMYISEGSVEKIPA